MARKSAAGKPEAPQYELEIESFDHEGRGVAHHDGKVVFTEGALPGERVSAKVLRGKKNYELAETVTVLRRSSMRETPRCPHFGKCGGCSSQHMDVRSQVAAKQRVLEDNLWHIGRVKPESMLPAIHGPSWEYRYKARIGARFVIKKDKMLVGFHERKSSYVADMDSCEVLPKRISNLLLPLRDLLTGLTIRDHMPQIELAIGEQVDVLVLRILQAITPADEAALAAFAAKWNIQFWLQPKGPDTAYPAFPPSAPQLTYTLPEYGVEMPFLPTDFTQVNHQINRLLVRRAMQLLQPQPGERIADFFCGLGNFSLPIARLGASVYGVESNTRLVERARENAIHNGLGEHCEFAVGNLFETDVPGLAGFGKFDKILIDPPREGALELVKAIRGTSGASNEIPAPQRIVYVSCGPATLARDAGVLCHEGPPNRYQLTAAGVVNMFPHTSHVESVAVFDLLQA